MSILNKAKKTLASENMRFAALVVGAFSVLSCSLGAGVLAARASNAAQNNEQLSAVVNGLKNILTIHQESINGASYSINPAALEAGVVIGVAALGVVVLSKFLSNQIKNETNSPSY